MIGRQPKRMGRTAAHGLRTAAFIGHYARLFLQANLTVAWEIITPGSSLTPAIIELPLRSRTRWEIASIAHLLTLTPGTLVLEVRREPPTLFIHGMHAADPEVFRASLTDLENRLLAVLRPNRR